MNKKLRFSQKALIFLTLATSFVRAEQLKQNIRFTDSNLAQPVAENKVTDIYGQEKKGKDVLLNRFDNFDVSKSNIVNMHFRYKDASNPEVENLVNMVKNKININGTLNAINKQGNIYFLSPDGMVISKDGIVNAGSFTVITNENQTFADNMVREPENVTLSENGKIEINGKINASGNVMLRSGKDIILSGSKIIAINKDIHIEAKRKLDVLKTTIKNTNEKNLSLTEDEKGNIFLKVNAVNERKDILDDPLPPIELNIKESSINSEGKLEVLNISNDSRIRLPFTRVYIYVKKSDLKAGRIKIDASASSTFNNKMTDLPEKLAGKAYDIIKEVKDIPKTGTVSYGENTSQIDIDKDSILTSTLTHIEDSKGIEINSNANLNISLTSSNSPKEDRFGLAVNFLISDNSSKVNINGTIKANDDVKISSNAKLDTKSTVITATNAKKAGKLPAVFGFSLLKGNNHSIVNIGSENEKVGEISSEGNVDILSKSENSISSYIRTIAHNGAYVSTSLNVVGYDSSALLNVNSNIDSKKNVDLISNNVVTNNSHTVDNGFIGAEQKPTSENAIFKKLFGEKGVYNIVIKKVVKLGFLSDKIKKHLKGEGEAEKKIQEILKKKLTAGVGISYIDEENIAKTTIGNVKIKGLGDVNIKSNLKNEDLFIKTKTQTDNIRKKDEPAASSRFNATTNIVLIKSDSKVIIKGDTKPNYEGISGNNVNIISTNKTPYARVEKMKKTVMALIDKLKNLDKFFEDEKYKKAVSDLEQAWDNLKNHNEQKKYEDYNDTVTKIHEIKDVIVKIAIYIQVLSEKEKDIPSDIMNLYNSILSFADLANYDNISAASDIKSRPDGDDQAKNAEKYALSGNFVYSDIVNNSTIIIAKDSRIKANEKLEIESNNDVELTTSAGGMSSTGKSKDGHSNGYGASIILSFFEGAGTTLIGKNSKLFAKNININSKNELQNKGSIFTAGSSVKREIEGMINILAGKNRAITLIDKGAFIGNKDTDKLDVNAVNGSTITSFSGGLLKSGQEAYGAAGSLNSYDLDAISGIVDLDLTEKSTNTNKDDITDEKIKRALDITKKITSDEEKNYLSDNRNIEGKLLSKDIYFNSESKGAINSISLAGSLSKPKTHKDKNEGIFSKIANVGKGLVEKIGLKKKKADEQVQDTNEDINRERDTDEQVISENEISNNIKITVDGSVSINLINTTTSTIIDKANIGSDEIQGVNIKSEANDKNFIGAFSGAGALSLSGETKDAQKTKTVGVAGSSSANDIERDSIVVIRGSEIQNAKKIELNAKKDGVIVSSGVGVAVSKNQSESGTSGVGTLNFSYTDQDDKLVSLMDTNDVDYITNEKNSLDINAKNTDLNIIGGMNVGIAKGGDKGIAVGANANFATINETLKSGINNGTYNNVGNVNVKSLTQSTKVGTNIGIISANGKKSPAFQGSFVYNKMQNNQDSYIKGATLNGANEVNVNSLDLKRESGEHNPYENKLKDIDFDVTGNSYKELAKSSNEEELEKETKANWNKEIKNDKGNNVIIGALSVSRSKENLALGAGVVVNDIKNEMNANILNSNITAKSLNLESKNNTNLTVVGTGVAGGSKFAAMGTFSVNLIKNISNSNIDKNSVLNIQDNLTVESDNKSNSIAVVGQIQKGSIATGLAMGYVNLHNYAISEVKNSTLNVSKKLNIVSNNESKTFNISLATALSKEIGALEGLITVNRGGNKTKSILSDISGNENPSLNIQANNESNITSVSGGIVYSDGTFAVGGASSTNDIKDDETVAKIENVPSIAGSNNFGNINVKANDSSFYSANSVGFALGGEFTANGAISNNILDKKVNAKILNSNISANISNINVLSTNESEIETTGVVVGVTKEISGGLGIGVNKIEQETSSIIKGGTFNSGKIYLNSVGNQHIQSIGVGAAIGEISAVGSVGVNVVDNDVISKISDTSGINSTGLGVVSESNDVISNYVGSVEGLLAEAALGINTVVNKMTGDTISEVKNAGNINITGNINIIGNNEILTRANVNEDALLNKLDVSKIFTPKKLIEARIDKNNRGFVVDSSSTHNLATFIASAGLTKQGAVEATANVNVVEGKTLANVNNTNIKTDKDVNINSTDYSNSSSFLGTLNGGKYVAVGVLSDTNVVKREVISNLIGNSNTSTISSRHFNVGAKSEMSFSNLDVSGGLVIEGASVGGISLVNKFKGKTKTNISNISSNYTGTSNIETKNTNKVFYANGDVNIAGYAGGAVGLIASIVLQDSTVETNIENSSIIGVENSELNINTLNNNVLDNLVVNVAGGIYTGAVAGTTSVFNMNQNVKTSVKNSSNERKIRAGTVNLKTNDDIKIKQINGKGAGAAVGVGVSVAVNTFNSSIKSEVINSNIEAIKDNVNINTNETRDINQEVINAELGVGIIDTNLAITSVNEEITNENIKNIKERIDDANKISNEDMNYLKHSHLSKEEIEDIKNDRLSNANTGKSNDDLQGVHTKILDDSNIKANQNINIISSEKNDISALGAVVSNGIVSVNPTVSHIYLKHDTNVDVKNSNIQSSNVVIKANQGNKDEGINIRVAQGSTKLIGVNASFAKMEKKGNTKIDILNSQISKNTLDDKSSIDIKVLDDTKTNIEAAGVNIEAVGTGTIKSIEKNNSDVTVNIKNNEKINSDQINITAIKENDMKVKSLAGSGGLGEGTGIIAKIEDSGNSNVYINGNKKINANELNIESKINPKNKLTIDSLTIGVIAGTAVMKADANMQSNANLEFKNNEDVDIKEKFNLKSYYGNGIDKTLNMELEGIGVSLGGEFDFNYIKAVSNIGLNMDISSNKITNAGDMSVIANNMSKKHIQATAKTVGGILATGANSVEIISNENINILSILNKNNKKNKNDILNVNSLSINIDNNRTADINVDGVHGSALISTPGAAFGSHRSTINNNIKLGGEWYIKKNLDINSTDVDNTKIVSKTVEDAMGITVGVANAENISNTTNNIVFEDSNITASNLNILAINEFKNGDEKDFAVSNLTSGDLVAVNDSKATASFTKKANIKLKNSNIKTSNNQVYLTKTKSEIFNKIAGQALSKLTSNSSVVSDNVINTNNSILLDETSSLTSFGKIDDSTITLTSYDDLDVSASSSVLVGVGAHGSADARTNTNINKGNNITINGKILSNGDVSLLSGKKIGNIYEKSDLNMDLSSAAYNHSLIDFNTNPSLEYNINENNLVDIKGDVKAIRHIRLNADEANTNIKKSSIIYNWHKHNSEDREYISNKDGNLVAGITSDNKVVVDDKATVTAGLNNKIDMTITGIKVPEGYVIKGKSDRGEYIITNGYEKYVEDKDIEILTDFVKRIEELDKLIAQYTSSDDVVKYEAERQFLIDQMLKYDLISIEKDPKDETKEIIAVKKGKLEMNILNIKDLAVSGGNIYINSKTKDIKGKIKAKGTPIIKITNNSSASIKIGSLEIGEKGGEIYYNGELIKKNTDKSKDEPSIILKNEYVGKKEINVTKDGREGKYVPINNVKLKGNIINKKGILDIENKSGNIVIESEKVNVKEIKLVAKESIYQLDEKIKHVGGDPKAIYDEYFKDKDLEKIFKNDCPLEGCAQDEVTRDEWNYDKKMTKINPSNISTIQSENNVYISAQNVNINGIIKSGYANYSVKITDEDVKKAIDDNKLKTVNGKKYYLVKESNITVKDEVGFDENGNSNGRQIEVYYDPVMKKLITEDIRVDGGNIAITGKILSTGNGKLDVASGNANVEIINESKYRIDVSKIQNKDRKGNISITDLKTDTYDLYNKAEHIHIDEYKKYLKKEHNNVIKEGYKTQHILENAEKYGWSNGSALTERLVYHSKEKNIFFDLIPGGKSTDFEEYEKHNTPENPEDDRSENLRNLDDGRFLDSSDKNLKDVSNLTVHGSKKIISETRTKPEKWVESTDFIINLTRTHHTKWEVHKGSKLTYYFYLSGQNPVNIKFTGTPKGNVDVKSNKSVHLVGGITNNDNLDISTTEGGIIQRSGVIESENIKMRAKKNILGINVDEKNKGVSPILDIETTNGSIVLNSNKGINVKNITAENGNVVLNSKNDIVNYKTDDFNDAKISTRSLILRTSQGKIGTTTDALNIKTNEDPDILKLDDRGVIIYSEGDVNVKQDEGNLKVGQIISKEGDVNINVKNGNIVDVLPETSSKNNTPIDALIQRWKDEGIIQGEGTYSKTIERRIENFKNSSKKGYDAYINFDPSKKDSPTYKKLYEEFGQYKTYEEYLEKSTDLKDLKSKLIKDTKKEALIYSLRDSLINKESGSTDNIVKRANISGKNVNIISKGVGQNKAPYKIKVANMSLEDLKKLAGSIISDVTVERKDGKITAFIIKGKTPLGIDATGKINITSNNKDVYISSRNKDEENEKPMNIKEIIGKNIRILGKKGIFNKKDDGVNITGESLIIEGGEENVGNPTKYIVTDINGDIHARSDKSIFIDNRRKTKIGPTYAGEKLSIKSSGDILQGSVKDSRIISKDIKFELVGTSSDIGNDDNGLVIQTGNDKLSILNANNVNIKGEDGEEKNLQLKISNASILNKIKIENQGDIVAESISAKILDSKTNKDLKVSSSFIDNITLDVDKDVNIQNISNVLNISTPKQVNGNVDITNKGSIVAKTNIESTGSIILNSLNSGNIKLKDVRANENIGINLKNGNLESTGNISSSQNLNVKIEKGNAEFKKDLSAHNNINVTLNEGSIIFKEQDDINVVSHKGNINLRVNNKGDITDRYTQDKTRAHLKAISGDVVVENKGIDNGDIEIYSIFAYGKSKIKSTNGDVKFNQNISGIIEIDGSGDKNEIEIDEVQVGRKLRLRADSVKIGKIIQFSEFKEPLIIEPIEHTEDKPMEKFEVDNIETIFGNDVKFVKLWAKNARVNSSEKDLFFDNLYIENEAVFKTPDMKTKVVGKNKLKYDRSYDSTYYIDTTENNPSKHLIPWKKAKQDDRWMKLKFLGDKKQYSTGNLVYYNLPYIVYDNRMTLLDIIRHENIVDSSIDKIYVNKNESEMNKDTNLITYNKIESKKIIPKIVETKKEDEIVVKNYNEKTMIKKLETDDEKERVLILGFKINFDIPSHEEELEIAKMAKVINKYVINGELELVGHTDSTGPDRFNNKLSVKRAKRVAHLLKKHGLRDSIKITKVSGMGSKKPVSTNKTKEGRFKNRRVDIKLYDLDNEK